jgi:hypothetical protein
MFEKFKKMPLSVNTVCVDVRDGTTGSCWLYNHGSDLLGYRSCAYLFCFQEIK